MSGNPPTTADLILEIVKKLEDKVDRLLAYQILDDGFDEEIKRDPSPKYFQGETHVGRRMSQCPVEYLACVVKYKEACIFMAEKENDPERKQWIERDRLTLARAKGWIKRLRERAAEEAPF